MGVNDYVGTRITNRPHGTLNYGPGKLNFDIDYYRQNFFQKNGSYTRRVLKSGKEVIYSSKSSNSKYMEFSGYDTCE